MFTRKQPALAGCTVLSALLFTPLALSQTAAFTLDDINDLKDQLEATERRLDSLENQALVSANHISPTRFNPQISVVLDGRYTAYSQSDVDYHLPGFSVVGEAGPAAEGFSIGHTELMMSSSVDDKFFGQLTLALAEHDGSTEVELEQAFIETLALGQGFSLRGGRFFSSVGYQNLQHAHAWDFVDAALVYSALWGNKNIDDGLRVSWLLPVDSYWELGYEAFAGSGYPNGERSNDIGSQVAFLKVGGDIGHSHSWLLGASWQKSDVEHRDLAGDHHDHGAEADDTITGYFEGDSDTWNVSLVYKWAPNGNYRNTHFKLQGEYFLRDESGDLFISDESHGDESTVYEGRLQGGYLQGIYQFMPQWAVGLRYDYLHSKHRGEQEVIDDAGLNNEGYSPRRSSVVVDWLPSEFSRVRLQYSDDQSDADLNQNVVTLAYTMSLGSHKAHSF